MAWEFTAHTPDELTHVREALPETAKPTVAGELLQMARLIEALAPTEELQFPLSVRHTGENAVPDFQLESGPRRIAVEMAKVTSVNLEHARSLQMKMPEPPSHFTVTNLCHPESLARKLKAGRDAWAKFLAAHLSPEVRAWLAAWNGQATAPDAMKEDLVGALNNIIDGPPIAGNPALDRAFPRPEVIQVKGFPCKEAPRDRKSWLEEAFWEDLVVPINPTLMVSPFIHQHESKMSRDGVLSTGFIVPALPIRGPTLQEEHAISVERVLSEVQDKTTKLTGSAFSHGDEDWLVLWDRLGTADWQLTAEPRRLRSVSHDSGNPIGSLACSFRASILNGK